MEILTQLLTDPKIWQILSPAGIVVTVLGYVIYKMFLRYDKLQELRVADIKQFNSEYQQLAKDVNSTLDLLVKLTGKNNGGSK